MDEATTVFEVDKADIAGSQYCYYDRGGVPHEFRLRQKTFYSSEQWHRALLYGCDKLQDITARSAADGGMLIPSGSDPKVPLARHVVDGRCGPDPLHQARHPGRC